MFIYTYIWKLNHNPTTQLSMFNILQYISFEYISIVIYFSHRIRFSICILHFNVFTHISIFTMNLQHFPVWLNILWQYDLSWFPSIHPLCVPLHLCSIEHWGAFLLFVLVLWITLPRLCLYIDPVRIHNIPTDKFPGVLLSHQKFKTILKFFVCVSKYIFRNIESICLPPKQCVRVPIFCIFANTGYFHLNHFKTISQLSRQRIVSCFYLLITEYWWG